jgi:hypothetical protein
MQFLRIHAIVRAAEIMALAVLAVLMCPRAFAQSEGAAGAPAAANPAGAATGPTAAATPKSACATALDQLAAGDSAGFKALPADARAMIVQGPEAQNAFTCLAIADGKTTYCDLLPDRAKGQCVEHENVIAGLKGLPKAALKAQIVYQMCLHDSTKDQCEIIRDAMVAGDAGKCDKLASTSKPSPWVKGGICGALATHDPSKCPGRNDADKAFCAAMATDDPSRCGKDSQECSKVVDGLARLSKDGLDGITDDPTLGGATKGRAGCQPLLNVLAKRFCPQVPTGEPSPMPPTAEPTVPNVMHP